MLLQNHKLAPDLYLGWCLALGSVRFSKLSRRLPEFPPWSGAVSTEDTRLQFPSYPGPFSISSSQIPVDPDKPCPSWCLQSANTCGHLFCSGEPEEDQSLLPVIKAHLCLYSTSLFMACLKLQRTASMGASSLPKIAQTLRNSWGSSDCNRLP